MGKRSITDAIVFNAAEMFLRRKAPSAEGTSAELNRLAPAMKERDEIAGGAPRLNRENAYPLIREARERGLIRLVPPLDEEMPRRLAQRFGRRSEWFTVVNNRGRTANEQVSSRAAEVVLDLVKA